MGTLIQLLAATHAIIQQQQLLLESTQGVQTPVKDD